jgi:hypothetical protein
LNKPTPIIEKISLTEDQKQEINDKLAGRPTKEMIERQTKTGISVVNWQKYYNPPSLEHRIKKIRNKYFRGVICSMCSKLPEYRAIWKLEGINLVEHYCSEHFDKIV